ncbi:MAG TPA: O-antigen ligase family protein [Flavisolibacter sp.]
MTSFSNRIVIYFFSFLLLIAAGLAAYLQEYYILFIPLGLIACMALLQHPEYLFYLLVLSIPWSVEYNFTPTIGTDLPDEPLMLLTAAASILVFIYHREKFNLSWIHSIIFLLIVQFAWILVTVITSTDVLVSLKYLLAKTWYLLAFVAAPLFLFRDEKILKRAVLILLFSMMAFMLFAMVKHAQNGWTFEKINDSLEPFFRNHVNYSALLVFMVPLLVAVMQATGSKFFKRILQALLLITLVALYFSYSRGAWLALIAGFVSYWLIRKKLLLTAYLAFLVICLGAVLWLKHNDNYLKFSPDYNTTVFHTDFREHLVATYQMKDVSTAERFHRWVGGVRMIEDSWKTGFGPTSFYKQYKSYTQPAFKTWVSKNEEQSTVHNYFLLLAIEQGIPGLLLFLILLGAMFGYAQNIYHRTKEKTWKVSMAAIGSILIMQCVINSLSDLVETDKVGSIFYLALSVIVIADLKTRKERNEMEAGV